MRVLRKPIYQKYSSTYTGPVSLINTRQCIGTMNIRQRDRHYDKTLKSLRKDVKGE